MHVIPSIDAAFALKKNRDQKTLLHCTSKVYDRIRRERRCGFYEEVRIEKEVCLSFQTRRDREDQGGGGTFLLLIVYFCDRNEISWESLWIKMFADVIYSENRKQVKEHLKRDTL